MTGSKTKFRQTIFQLFILLLTLSTSLVARSQSLLQVKPVAQNEYQIHGNVGGLKDGIKVYLSLIHSGFGDEDNLEDSAVVKNNEFVLKGIVRNGPRWYFLRFQHFGGRQIRLLMNGDDQITIRIDDISLAKYQHTFIDQMPSVVIEGSCSNKAKDILWHSIQNYRNMMYGINRALDKM